MKILGWLAIALLLAPFGYAVWISFSPDTFLTPPTGSWSLRWYVEFGENRRWSAALVRSLTTALGASLVAVSFGTPLAYAVARHRFRGRRIVASIAIAPALVPPAVLGMGLLPFLFVVDLWGSPIGLILAHGLLGLPVVLLIVRSSLDGQSPDIELAARGLGASPWQVARRVTLPLIRPAILAGALAAFVGSLNEGLVSLFLATPSTETLPAVVWPQLRHAASPLVAVASTISAFAAALACWGVAAFGHAARKPGPKHRGEGN